MKKHALALAITIAVLSGAISPAILAEPVAWNKPDQTWLSQDSEHFSIHFSEAHREQAARALDIAERVHTDQAKFFARMPQNKTEVVLVDEKDFSNGWATPLPFAQIRLYMSPPQDVNSLESYDEWMHMLIRHEYAHIVHMELGAGTVNTARSLLGRNVLLYPHALTPAFLLEGLAVYLETSDRLGYGRLQSSIYNMQMRAEVASGELKSLSQVSVAAREWPRGYQYLYGAWFIEYLTEIYGEEKLRQFLDNYSSRLIPWFFLHRTARNTFGKDFEQLWSDYQVWLTSRFEAEISFLEDHKVTGVLLDTNPYLQPMVATQDGFLVNRNDGENRPVLATLTRENGKSQWSDIENTRDVTAIDSHQEAGLVISRIISYADGRDSNDLFLFNNKQWRRLTNRQRFRKARWLPDGQSVIASRIDNGLSELWRVPVSAPESASLIWRGAEHWVLGDFSVSPDGETIAASLKRPQQGWNLELLHIDTAQWQALTDTKATENSPSFTNADQLVFSADYDGIYNIYSLDLNSRQLNQLTSETNGAFAPAWQADLGLAYQVWGNQAYELRLLAQPRPLKQFALSDQQGRHDYPPAVIKSVSKSAPFAYSPWSSLRPRSWFPILELDDQQTRVGLTTWGSDALGRHYYRANGSWDTKNHLGAYSLIYGYDNRWFMFLERSHEFETFSQAGTSGYRISREDSALLQRDHIFTAWEDQLSLHAGVYLDKSGEVSPPAISNIPPFFDTDESLVGVALTFDNRQTRPNVPGVGWGHYVDIVAETNDLLDSYFEGEKYQLRWQGTWDMPGRTTLTAQLAAGYASDAAKAFRLGGSDISQNIGLFGRDTQILRGYDENVQRGHHYTVQRLSMNTWLARVEDNWSLYPAGIGDISASVFIDSGSMWDRRSSAKQLTGVGVELTVEAILGYSLIVPVTLGFAKGLDDNLGENKGYVNISGQF